MASSCDANHCRSLPPRVHSENPGVQLWNRHILQNEYDWTGTSSHSLSSKWTKSFRPWTSGRAAAGLAALKTYRSRRSAGQPSARLGFSSFLVRCELRHIQSRKTAVALVRSRPSVEAGSIAAVPFRPRSSRMPAQIPYAEWSLRQYSIGPKLRALRTSKRLTLSRLAAQSGLSTALLSKLETEFMIPTLPTLAIICKVYGVGLSHFFCEPEHHRVSVTRKAHLTGKFTHSEPAKFVPLNVLGPNSR